MAGLRICYKNPVIKVKEHEWTRPFGRRTYRCDRCGAEISELSGYFWGLSGFFWTINPDSKVVWNEETGEWEIRELKEGESADVPSESTRGTRECICFVGKSRYCTVHGNE